MPNLEKKKEYNKAYREKKKQEEEELKRQIEEQKRLLDERKKTPETPKVTPQVKHENEIKEDIVADTKTTDMIVDFDEFQKLVDEKAKEKALFFLKNTKKDTEKQSNEMITGAMKTAIKATLDTVVMMSVPLMIKIGLSYFQKPSIPSNVLQNQNLMNLRNMPLPQQSTVSQQKPENDLHVPFGVSF